jgi:hydrogenase maturation protease
MMRTLVLGLGNPILTDDGVGVRVAEAVQAALPPAEGAALPPIEVQEVSVGGLALMETMIGYERVILIDALWEPDVAPGSVQRMTLDDLRAISPTQHSASPHDANLITALALGRSMGLPLPAEIIIYAIGVENVLDFADTPTPAVAAAIPQVVAAVLHDLYDVKEGAHGFA